MVVPIVDDVLTGLKKRPTDWEKDVIADQRGLLLRASTKELTHQQDHRVHVGEKSPGEEGNENDSHA